MIIPRSIRSILAGKMSTALTSGRVSISSAPDFTVSGPTPELTEFFDDVTRRISVRGILPRLFSTLSRDGIAHIMVGSGCEACGLGRMMEPRRGCPHPGLFLDEAMIVNPGFILGGVNNMLRPLHQIERLLSDDGRRSVEDAISTGSEMMRVWADCSIMMETWQLATVAVPVGSVWGTVTSDTTFRNQMDAVGGWIGDVCGGVARMMGVTLGNIGTMAGEVPVPIPHIRWSC